MSAVKLCTEKKNHRNMENDGPTSKKHFETNGHSFPDTFSTKPMWMTGQSLRSQVHDRPKMHTTHGLSIGASRR